MSSSLDDGLMQTPFNGMATTSPAIYLSSRYFGPVPNADDAPEDPVDDDAALDIQVRLDITS
jgi:hypothetical protein